MKQEDKELLLKDLSARLPYGVFVQQEFAKHHALLQAIDVYRGCVDIEFAGFCGKYDRFKIEHIKPYLRPMSSMTGEEKSYIRNTILPKGIDIDNIGDMATENGWTYIPLESMVDYIAFLVEGHFDYNGLIPKGLALKAKEDMYD